jgi:HK97 gp10 family phage protein
MDGIRTTMHIPDVQLKNALNKLGVFEFKIRAEVIAAVQETATEVAGTAKELAPVDTGRLRSSIRQQLLNFGLSAEVSTDVEYAAFVEFGTARRAATPFLFPASESEQPRYVARLREALRSKLG